jgi:hypothetical protein
VPGDHEVIDAPVWLERLAQALRVDRGHEEVRIFRVEPEKLVADGAADEVGVEPKRSNVLLEFRQHTSILAVSATLNLQKVSDTFRRVGRFPQIRASERDGSS